MYLVQFINLPKFLDAFYAILSKKFGFSYYDASRICLGEERWMKNVPVEVNQPLVCHPETAGYNNTVDYIKNKNSVASWGSVRLFWTKTWHFHKSLTQHIWVYMSCLVPCLVSL